MIHPFQLAAGIALVAAVLIDVFATVVVPRAARQRLRIAPALVRLIEPGWRRAARLSASSRTRQSVRGWLGPVVLLLSLALWMVLLTVGFALIFHAEPGNVRSGDFGFDESLFQSAMALSTLGTIDARIDGWGRGVVATAGIAGFATLSLVVAFVLAIQSALHRREGLVLTLPARAGRVPSAFALLSDYRDADDRDLAMLFDRWEMWTADLTQSHLAYPVLMYFHSLDEDAEWLSCLAAVSDAGALIATAAPVGYPRAAAAGRRLTRTADQALAEFATLFRITTPTPSPPDERDLAARLTTIGFAAASAAAFEERWRSARCYARLLPLLAHRLDIAWADPLRADL